MGSRANNMCKSGLDPIDCKASYLSFMVALKKYAFESKLRTGCED